MSTPEPLDPVQLQVLLTGVREALAAAAERSMQATPRTPGTPTFRRAADPALLAAASAGPSSGDRRPAVDPVGFAALLAARR